MRKIAILFSFVGALTGCKMWADADLFTSDLLSVLETGQPLTTPLELAFEIGSKSECEKVNGGLLPALTDAYGDAESLGCEQRGFDSVALFRVPVEIVHEIENQKADSAQPIFIGVYSDVESVVTVAFFQSAEGVASFRGAIPEELTRFGGKDVEPLLSATIQNDLRGAAKLHLSDVYADGRAIPVQTTKAYDLARRSEVKIVLSDVSNDALAQGYSHAIIGHILLPQ